MITVIGCPAGLKPDYIAGDVLSAEVFAVVHRVVYVVILICHERKSVCPFREHYRSADDARIFIKHFFRRRSGKKVNVKRTALCGYAQSVLFLVTDVNGVTPRRIEEQSPTVVTVNEGNRDIALDVANPHFRRKAGFFYLTTRCVAETVNPCAFIVRKACVKACAVFFNAFRREKYPAVVVRKDKIAVRRDFKSRIFDGYNRVFPVFLR